MRVEHNVDSSYCNCNFEWVVIDDNGFSIFGANTEGECLEYINNHKVVWEQ
jgi:hypothetical protein